MTDSENKGQGHHIYLAFRFHINFYHSYRGDTPDELGFGKDIRIIRSILDDLDTLNTMGIRVKGTWDVENYYSLETIMPEHCPDIIRRIQKRIEAGLDEIEVMSWNNGIVSACNEKEFNLIARKTIRNREGSGLADMFGWWAPLLRPQECMYTPSFLRLYPEAGITGISTFYSSHPFNGFSNFVPLLNIAQRYNPLTLCSDSQEKTMVIVPSYNNGDVADHMLSLRHWIVQMRRQQRRMDTPRDLLLVIDMDADDEFWSGLDIPVLSRLFASLDGLKRMVQSIAGLRYLRFTTPGEYMKDHEPAGTITVNQDTADGSFDGLSSWAEKWDNTALWSIIQDSRKIAEAASYLSGSLDLSDNTAIRSLLHRCLETRVLAQSTTHFGMASPVMNSDRLQKGRLMAEESLDNARKAVYAILEDRKELSGRCLTGSAVTEEGRGTVCFLSSLESDSQPVLIRQGGKAEPQRLIDTAALKFLVRDTASEDAVSGQELTSGKASLKALQGGYVELRIEGKVVNSPGFPLTAVTYGKKTYCHHDGIIEPPGVRRHNDGGYSLTLTGHFSIDRGKDVRWRHTYHIAPALPYIYVEVEVSYPETEHRGYDKDKAERLNTSWDARWKEVMPWQFSPSVPEGRESTWRVWKHNFFGDVSFYDLDYDDFSKNRNLDSFNNQITNAWVGVSRGKDGWLLSQSCAQDNNFAFCPMRLRNGRLMMNPFGSYYGRQWKYGARETGLGRLLALGMADHLEPYAPSYNGRTSRFTLMLGSFSHEPDALLKRDAQVFSDGVLALARTPVSHQVTASPEG